MKQSFWSKDTYLWYHILHSIEDSFDNDADNTFIDSRNGDRLRMGKPFWRNNSTRIGKRRVWQKKETRRRIDTGKENMRIIALKFYTSLPSMPLQ